MIHKRVPGMTCLVPTQSSLRGLLYLMALFECTFGTSFGLGFMDHGISSTKPLTNKHL